MLLKEHASIKEVLPSVLFFLEMLKTRQLVGKEYIRTSRKIRLLAKTSGNEMCCKVCGPIWNTRSLIFCEL